MKEQPINTHRYCTKCGEFASAASKFCTFCGAELKRKAGVRVPSRDHLTQVVPKRELPENQLSSSTAASPAEVDSETSTNSSETFWTQLSAELYEINALFIERTKKLPFAFGLVDLILLTFVIATLITPIALAIFALLALSVVVYFMYTKKATFSEVMHVNLQRILMAVAVVVFGLWGFISITNDGADTASVERPNTTLYVRDSGRDNETVIVDDTTRLYINSFAVYPFAPGVAESVPDAYLVASVYVENVSESETIEVEMRDFSASIDGYESDAENPLFFLSPGEEGIGHKPFKEDGPVSIAPGGHYSASVGFRMYIYDVPESMEFYYRERGQTVAGWIIDPDEIQMQEF